MANIYPFIQPALHIAEQADGIEYRDIAWDYAANMPRFSANGEPEIVSGLEAVKSWAWRALHTERFLNDIYSWNYGCEIMTLAGQQWIREVKEAEAVRYVRECLIQHSDISGIANAYAGFDGSMLTIRCTAITSYGNADIEVNYNV